MVSDPDEIERVLGRPVRALAIPGTEDVAFAADIEPGEILSAWRLARAHVEDLGRSPVVVMSWFGGSVDDEVLAAGWPEGHTPSAMIADAVHTPFADGLAAFRAFDDWWEGDRWPTWIDVQLRSTTDRIGDAPAPEEVIAAIDPPNLLALERWLLAWEEARRPTVEPDSGEHLAWFDPPDDLGLAVLLLPTVVNEDVAVFVPTLESVYSAGDRVALAAVLRSWRERFGAEVVASWGTMLQFVVARPPDTLETALQLAIEHDRVAGDTLAGPGVRLREHARALLGRETWFLHSRP